MTEKHDICVIGGGYAGLAAATAAARKGADTVLYEQYGEIGRISRCGGGTVLEEVSAYFDPADISQKISKISFISENRRSDHEIPELGLVVLDTSAYLKRLEKVALGAGVKIQCARTIGGIIKKGRRVAGVSMKDRDGKFHDCLAGMTIDCSGVARCAYGKIGKKLEDTQKAFGIEIEVDRQEFSDRGDLIVGSSDAPSGYAWIFPCPHGRTRIGVGFISPKYWRKAEKYLVHVLKTRCGSLNGGKIVSRRGGFVPSHYPVSKIVYDGFAVAGDAGGHISLLTGEGTRFALKWGNLIGSASASIISGNSNASAELDVEWKKYRRSLAEQYLGNRLMMGLSDKQWDWGVAKLSGVGNGTLSALLKCETPLRSMLRKVARKLIGV